MHINQHTEMGLQDCRHEYLAISKTTPSESEKDTKGEGQPSEVNIKNCLTTRLLETGMPGRIT